jgi:Helix-turn-helix domain
MIEGETVAKNREQTPQPVGDLSPERIARDDAIEAQCAGNPSLREQYERGDFDQEAYDRLCRLRATGPPARPFGDLIAALRAERERQGLSLADIAGRSGMDRAAVHKLEIGLNKNPTAETLNRYVGALGKRIEWAVTDRIEGPPATRVSLPRSAKKKQPT